ncbi:hypothetical protein PG637_01520 [Riemerella anatipestifer]|nr:hypothetical protein [Riemerella anatipestifer]MDY3318085.1 hypothetical protein [Riemerella anatipestifer]MDY3324348.1 hypothetical protein [Riemerella anatipestifer]MDY3353163.1 hypothetical protein [Riemerella anatipestifer]
MKNLLKLITVFAISISALTFAKESNNEPKNGIEVTLKERNGKKSIVTEEEYNAASEFTKRMINQIDGAIAALEVLKDNPDNADLEAIVTISKNKNDKFRNAILISKPESSKPLEVQHGSCTVCGVRSAYKCLSKINADSSLGDEFDVHVERLGDGCVRVSW